MRVFKQFGLDVSTGTAVAVISAVIIGAIGFASGQTVTEDNSVNIQSENSNNAIGDGSIAISGDVGSFVNADEIGTLFIDASSGLSDDDRQLMQTLADHLAALTAQGELQITQKGLETLGRETASFLSNPSYTGNNVVVSTVHSARRAQVQWIDQTGVGFSWEKTRPCTRAGEIKFTLVGAEPICITDGDIVTVPFEPKDIQIIYQGRSEDRPSSERTFVVKSAS